MLAVLVSQTSPVVVQIVSYFNAFFNSKKFTFIATGHVRENALLKVS